MLRAGRLPVRQDQRVRGREQGQDLAGGHVPGTQRDPGTEAEAGDQRAGAGQAVGELPGHGERDVLRGPGQGPEQDVQALVRADRAKKEKLGFRVGGGKRHGPFRQIRRGGGKGRYGGRQVRRHPRDDDRDVGSQLASLGGLRGGVDDHGVDVRQEGPGQGRAGREGVVADEHGAGTPRGQGGQHRQVGRHLARAHQGEDDQVGGAEPAASGDPAVRAMPGQPTVGARVRLSFLELRSRGAPRLDDDVVASGGQTAGQFGGVPCATALVGVGRPD